MNNHEKLLQLRDSLIAVEKDRESGQEGCTIEELESYLDNIIANEMR